MKICKWFFGTLIFLWAGISTSQSATFSQFQKGSEVIVYLEGEIVEGDYSKLIEILSNIFNNQTKKFRDFKKNKPDNYKIFRQTYGETNGTVSVSLFLNSPGGSVSEAIKIGRVVRDMLLTTRTGIAPVNSGLYEGQCLSSCFLIWAAGVERVAGRTLGVHRTYFNKEYYKDLSSDQAETIFKNLRTATETYLQDIEIDQNFINKMYNYSSNEIYYFDQSDVDDLSKTTPYLEELLISKCGSFTEQEHADLWKYRRCSAINTRKEECYEGSSKKYIDYIEQKVSEIDSCNLTTSAIERWKRMAKYFLK